MEDIVTTASLDTTGLKTAVCDVNNIKKARYTIQVIAVVLTKLLKKAFNEKDDDDSSFEEWINNQQTNPMFHYWHNVLKSIKVVLMIVRSFREANIELFIAALEHMVPLFFALDHIHYSRWVSVFLEDLKLLPTKQPILYEEFKKGHFVVNTRGNKFSKIAMDQAQEHNNKKIKSSGSGYIDLVNIEDKAFLEKIELCWPEMHQYFVAVEGPPDSQGHKESTARFISKFCKDCSKVYDAVLTYPFSTAEFSKLNSSFIFPEAVVTDSMKVFTVGKDQYGDFCRTRFVLCTHDIITSKISKNDFKLPKDSDIVKVENPRITVNDKLLNKLRDACDIRSELVKQVFRGEWTGVPECLVTKDGTPYHNPKAEILDCFGSNSMEVHPKVEALVVDLSVITRSQASVIALGSTFDELGDRVIKNITSTAMTHEATRLDIVLDLYDKKSIKHPTRCDRKSKGFGHQISFKGDTMIPKEMAKTFLADEQNKSKLNEFIVQKFIDSIPTVWDKEFCITNGSKNVHTDGGERVIYSENLISVLEEADNRIVCHINNLLQHGFKRISVKTADSDVVVILLRFMKEFLNVVNDLMLVVDFNSSGNRRILSMNSSYLALGEDIRLALPFFHCLTGPDSTSSFYKLSKKDWFAKWMSFPHKDSLTDIFQNLSRCPTKEEVIDSQTVMQNFVTFAFSKDFDGDLDDLRFHIFRKSSSNELRILPPSKDALLQHLFRSSYQAGWVWGNTLLQREPPEPETWGWRSHQTYLRIHWNSLDVNQQLQNALSICQCRTAKCKTCRCAKNQQKCLKFCNCCRKCKNV